MARTFFDTSALVKLYHQEPGTTQAILEFEAAQPEGIFVSSIADVEFASALATKVRTAHLEQAEFALLRDQFLHHLGLGIIVPLRVNEDVLKRAVHLLERYAIDRHLRSLDAIQLATALQLNQALTSIRFVCSDRRLSSIAKLEGLITVEP